MEVTADDIGCRLEGAVGRSERQPALRRQPARDRCLFGCQGVFGGVRGAGVGPLAGGSGLVVGAVVGPGCDLSEEPAVQDAMPVTLESESFLGVLPGPLDRQLLGRRPSLTSWR